MQNRMFESATRRQRCRELTYSSRNSSHRGSRDIEHLGSARGGAEVELLKAAARQRLAAGQGELDLGLAVGVPGGPLPITSSRMAHLWDALAHAYRALGFDGATGGDEVFRQLVLARIIEPTSKLDSARLLEETGISGPRHRVRLLGHRDRAPAAPAAAPARRYLAHRRAAVPRRPQARARAPPRSVRSLPSRRCPRSEPGPASPRPDDYSPMAQMAAILI
jgi:hypothetical protein